MLENTSVFEDRTTGEKSPTVHYLDFENIDNNSFIAVSQFKIRILGTEHHIVPDIVLFLNGLPVVVVECKSPKVKEPIPDAIDQMLRYSEQRGEAKECSSPLFYCNQFLVATCRQCPDHPCKHVAKNGFAGVVGAVISVSSQFSK